MDLITRLFSFVYKVQASGAGDDSSTFRSKFTRGFSMPLGRGTRQLFVLRFWKQPYLRLVLCIRHILRVKIHRSPVKSRGRNMLDTRYNFKLIPFFFFFRNSWTWYHPTPDYIIAKIYIYIATFTRIHIRIHERQICFGFFCDRASDRTNSFSLYCSNIKKYCVINNFENCISNEKKERKEERKKEREEKKNKGFLRSIIK